MRDRFPGWRRSGKIYMEQLIVADISSLPDPQRSEKVVGVPVLQVISLAVAQQLLNSVEASFRAQMHRRQGTAEPSEQTV
jgi:hypothetical protein